MIKEDVQSLVSLYQKKLAEMHLAPMNWGNCSIYNRNDGVIAIKPSGVHPDNLSSDKIVLVDINGQNISGKLKPSSDLETHLEIYRQFDSINSVIHTHSKYATLFAQARSAIPCLGTTHADIFKGEIPVTRLLQDEEVRNCYEHNTGKLIVEHFKENNIDPLDMPGVLVASHGPFVWGTNIEKAFIAAFTLEYVAEMAMHTFQLKPNTDAIPQYLSSKHFDRKHGSNAYYGQMIS